jgi:hypothetical protein
MDKRMTKYFLIIIVFSLGFIYPEPLIAQESIEFIDAKSINKNRYRNVRGLPYMFETWQIGTIYGSNLTVYQDVFFNYNGESQKIEIKKGGEILELDPKSYLRAEIPTGKKDVSGRAEKIILQRGVHKKFEQAFVRVVFRGRRIILVEQFIAKISDKTTIQIGEKESFKQLMNDRNYFLKHHATIKQIKLDQKSIVKALGHEEEMMEFVGEKQLDLSLEPDIARLLKWYEDKGFVR